jgi:hypothetical protein
VVIFIISYWADGKQVRYHREPETTFWQRFTAGFIEMLPVEKQL